MNNSLIFTSLIIYWIFGLIWWKRNVYKKVTGSNNNEIWEAISLFTALLGGIFIFLYELLRENHKSE